MLIDTEKQRTGDGSTSCLQSLSSCLLSPSGPDVRRSSVRFAESDQEVDQQ